MTIPKWNDPNIRAGTMIRTALWLVTEVGVGNSFTKEQHRKAFTGVAQADRRLRDLRAHGWVINTSTEDLTLNSNEQRLVAVGQPVWEQGVRKSTGAITITTRKRMEAFSASDYQCTICGIAAGERYLDASHSAAVLSVSRHSVKRLDGRVETMIVCECNRCRVGADRQSTELTVLKDKVTGLSEADRAIFIRWAKSGRGSQLDRVWAEFRCLPPDAKDELRNSMTNN